MWIFFGILAAFFFALEDICVKTLIDDGLSVYEVIAFSFVFAGILSTGYLFYLSNCNKLKLPGVFWKKNTKWIIIFTVVAFFLGTVSYFTGLNTTPNPGYTAALASLSILLLYFYSIRNFNSKFDKIALIGVILMIIGAYLITSYSED